MKLNILRKIVASLIICLTIVGFSSCSDDLDGCGLTVVVTDSVGNRIPGAHITVGVDINGEIADGNTIKRDATADRNGEAYFFFDNEAIFTIYASILAEDGYTLRSGKSTVQLKYNEMVTKDVILP